MTEKIVMIGNSITAKIFFDMLKADSAIEIAAFSVHERFLNNENLFGKKVVPFENLCEQFPPSEFKLVNAVGYSNINQNREKIYVEAKQKGYSLLTYIHSAATNFAKHIGEGVFIMPGAVIEPFVSVGANSVIWSRAVVAHDATIAENCWIGAGSVVAGGAKINRNCFLGVNSTIVNNVIVEAYNIIGAQTLISKNTSQNSVYLTRSGELHRFASQDYAQHCLA